MYHLRLLGGLSVTRNGERLDGRATQPRRLALLALIAAAGEGGASREKLVATLWPEAEQAQGRHLLAVAVHQIRKALGEGVVVSQGDELRLEAESWTCDLWEFRADLQAGELERAVERGSGAFLDGFYLDHAGEFERWVEQERARVEHAWTAAAETLAERLGGAGDLRGAVEAWRLLAAHEPYNSRYALRLMEALDSASDPAGALQHARQHAERLRTDFQVEPDAAVLAFVRGVRQRHAEAAGNGAAVHSAGEVEPRGGSGSAGRPRAGTARFPRRGLRIAVARARRGGTVLSSTAFAFLMAVTVVAITVAVWLGVGRREAPPGLASIAVLPFLTEEDGVDHLSSGLAEELSLTLSQVPGLRVSARTSARTMQERRATVPEIAARLGVQYVVEGRVLQREGTTRVHARLVDGRTDQMLWEEEFERPSLQLIGLEREITRGVLSALQRRVMGPEPVGRPVSAEAYDHYLRGRHMWHQREDPAMRGRSLEGSIAHYEAALRLEPAYAAAYAGLADSYASLAGSMPPLEAYARAETAARTALALDDRLVSAHLALARVLVFRHWDWAGAGRSYRQALELGPSDERARQWYGMYLLHLGRPAEALAELQRARQLDPLSLSINLDLGRGLYFAGHYPQAREQLHRTLELYPGTSGAHLHLGLTFAEMQQADSALHHLYAWGRLAGEEPRALVGYVLARAGRRAEARRVLDGLLQQAERDSAAVSAVGIATIQAHLGLHDDAITWLERAADHRSPFILYLRVSPRVDPLRAHPRFARLLARVGLATADAGR